MFCSVKLLENEAIKKIRLEIISWEDIISDKTILYSAITDLLLNKENLLYYATQKESTKTLSQTRKYIKNLIKNGCIKQSIDDVLNGIGWNKDISIYKTIFQGDLAEYLMNIFIDKLTNIDTIISKISLKTSDNMPVYGNDNYYFDFKKKILYFGESKFYNDFKTALGKAYISIKDHDKIKEISFVRNHTSSFISENLERREKLVEEFETIPNDQINKKAIIFVVNDDIYLKKDYEKEMIDYFKSKENIEKAVEEVIFVFLPIISKTEFLNYFKGRLENE